VVGCSDVPTVVRHSMTNRGCVCTCGVIAAHVHISALYVGKLSNSDQDLG